jgi:hypothetical protein
MFRVRTVFTGAAGAPYYSNLYFLGPAGQQGVVTAVLNMWTDLVTFIANDLTMTVEGETAEIDPASGDLTGFTALNGGTVQGSNTGARLSRATQGLVQFRTDGIVNSRRVRGRMFVPGVCVSSNSDGEPTTGYISGVLAAYNNRLQAIAIRDTNPHVIWARPYVPPEPGDIAPNDPTPPPPRDGSAHIVNAASVWNEWAIQRSRRD